MPRSSTFYFLLSIFCPIILLSTFYFLFSVHLVQAAELNLTSQTQEFGVNQQFQIDLILDTENEEINAVEGKVSFPGELLELKEIRDGNSIINFWIERPSVLRETDANIVFSGITPGGFNGKDGLIFTVVFEAKKEGSGTIEIQNVKVLLNDGEGTPADLSISNFQFPISKETPGFEFQVPGFKDTDPPESFGLEIGQNADIFEGKYFLVFDTQDKGSGIDHYEIQENKKPNIEDQKWILKKSPYLLQDQKLKSYIYVKAIDRAGNERIAELPSQNLRPGYENYLLWVIIGLGAIIGFLIWKIAKLKIK
ncbi:MAG: cohesin domain-containing protein [Candidatus Doudnabacteria bacterium]